MADKPETNAIQKVNKSQMNSYIIETDSEKIDIIVTTVLIWVTTTLRTDIKQMTMMMTKITMKRLVVVQL